MSDLLVLLFGTVLGLSIGYGAFVIYPRKLRLIRRLGPSTTNADLIAAVRAGDAEAQELHRLSRRLLWMAIPSGIGLVLTRHLSQIGERR